MLAAVGMGMIDRVPWKSPAMYSRTPLPSPPGATGLGPSRLALRAGPLAVGHEDRLAVARDPHRGGIPARGDESQRRAGADLLHVHHGQVVGIGVGDQENGFIGGKRQRAGRAAGGSLGIDGRADGLDGLPRHRVDHAHRVAVGVGDVEDLAPAGQEQLVGMLLGRDGGQQLERLGVDHGDGRAVPEADVEAMARLVPGQTIRVGIGPEGDRVVTVPVDVSSRATECPWTLATQSVLPSAESASPPGTWRAAPLRRISEDRLVRQQSARVVEAIDPIVEPAAHVELLAVGRPDQTRERLGKTHAADDPSRRSARRDHLVLPVAGVDEWPAPARRDASRSGPGNHRASSAARPA